MAVTIRLKRMGSKKNAFYRIVAADIRRARDGRFIEILGYYDPMKDPPDIRVDDDKVFKWLGNGAKPTENARSILRRIGILERWQLLKSGVEIHQLDSVIEERRAKQPSARPKKEEKVEEAPPPKEEIEKEAREEEEGDKVEGEAAAPAGEQAEKEEKDKEEDAGKDTSGPEEVSEEGKKESEKAGSGTEKPEEDKEEK